MTGGGAAENKAKWPKFDTLREKFVLLLNKAISKTKFGTSE